MKSFEQTSLAIIRAGALTAAALACAPSWAAGSSAASVPVAAEKAVTRHDFRKLSRAGIQMMVDISLARASLFDGHTTLAAKQIKRAQLAIRQAQKDNTAFLKAESDLSPVPGHEKPASPDTTVKAWLPVGGGVEVIDDYKTLTPEKAKAVEKANAKLKHGDEKGAVQQLKLADVHVISSVELAPLDTTVAGVNEAAGLMDADKYYEAGQVLHRIQDSIRVAVLDVDTAPTPTQKAK
jgi:hypothetical protein